MEYNYEEELDSDFTEKEIFDNKLEMEDALNIEEELENE